MECVPYVASETVNRSKDGDLRNVFSSRRSLRSSATLVVRRDSCHHYADAEHQKFRCWPATLNLATCSLLDRNTIAAIFSRASIINSRFSLKILVFWNFEETLVELHSSTRRFLELHEAHEANNTRSETFIENFRLFSNIRTRFPLV